MTQIVRKVGVGNFQLKGCLSKEGKGKIKRVGFDPKGGHSHGV